MPNRFSVLQVRFIFHLTITNTTMIMSTRTTPTAQQQVAWPFCLTQNAGYFLRPSKNMYFPLDNFFVDPTIIVSTRTSRKHIAGTSTLQKQAGYFESLPNETHFSIQEFCLSTRQCLCTLYWRVILYIYFINIITIIINHMSRRSRQPIARALLPCNNILKSPKWESFFHTTKVVSTPWI